MKYGDKVGWLGVALGTSIGLPQLYKIITTGQTEGIAIGTYILLVLALNCYLLHAIHIRSKVFITAQSLSLVVNFTILMYLIGG